MGARMRTKWMMTLVTVLLVSVTACGTDAADNDEQDAAADATQETGDADEADDELSSAGAQLGGWPEGAAELLPLPNVLDISTASPSETHPAFRGSSDEHPVEDVAADIDALMDELGWEVTDRREDGAWLLWDAEHDEWTANVSIKDHNDGAGTFTEGGLTRKE